VTHFVPETPVDNFPGALGWPHLADRIMQDNPAQLYDFPE
jgi:hypothetical protein